MSMSFWPELPAVLGRWFPEPWLVAAGLAALALVPAGALWAALDGRRVSGERVALKPSRFALSIGVYLLTASWMLGYARPERLSSWPVQSAVRGLLVGAAVELTCIIFQAARGRRSHFNTATPVDAAISVTMAVMAILFIGMVLPLAWEIARFPRPGAAPLMVWAIVGGLVATFVLGAATGAGMGRPGAAAKIPDVVRLPLLGWCVRGGYPRVAHFLGVHAMQASPLMAAVVLAFGGRTAPVLLAMGTLAYGAMTLMLLFHPTFRGSRPALPVGAAPKEARS